MAPGVLPFDRLKWVWGSLELRTQSSEAEIEVLADAFSQMNPWKRLGFSKASLKRYLLDQQPGRTRVSVYASETLIGVLVIRYPWLRGPFIEFMGFLEEAQRKGYGREVFLWVESEIQGHAQNLWITASAFNEAALTAYERMGFSRVGILEDLVTKNENEVLLRKKLVVS